MKKALVVIILSVIVLSIVIFTRSAKVPITNSGPIVALGASLFEGVGASPGNDLPQQISERLGKPVLNLGVSGNTSADGLARINQVPVDASIVILSLGGNDILKRVPATETEANLKKLINQFTKNGSVVVLLDVRGPIGSGEYRDVYQSVAESNSNVVLVPNVLRGILTNTNLMSDLIHPNDAGYAIMADRISEAILTNTNLN